MIRRFSIRRGGPMRRAGKIIAWKKEFIGTCVDNPFGDLETLENVIDGATEITRDAFLSSCDVPGEILQSMQEYPHDYGFYRSEHDVVHIAGNYTTDKPPCKDEDGKEIRLPYTVYRPHYSNPNGFDLVDAIVGQEEPEILCLMMDVGTAYEWLRHEELRNLYTVAYLAIEGAPPMPSWCKIIKQIPRAIVFTKFTAEEEGEQ